VIRSCEVWFNLASMLASGLKGVVGDTIDATVMLLVAVGDTELPTFELAATGDGVLSPAGEYPVAGGVKRCWLFVETTEVSGAREMLADRLAKC
jgi:hypothetical protein